MPKHTGESHKVTRSTKGELQPANRHTGAEIVYRPRPSKMPDRKPLGKPW